MSMNFSRKLPVPKEIKELYPLSEEIKTIKKDEAEASSFYVSNNLII